MSRKCVVRETRSDVKRGGYMVSPLTGHSSGAGSSNGRGGGGRGGGKRGQAELRDRPLGTLSQRVHGWKYRQAGPQGETANLDEEKI